MADRIVVLNKGVIQQFDTPQNIYNNPNNQFVAGFIGQMNFIHSDIENDCLIINDVKIPLTEELLKRLDGMPDVTIGIRPEKLQGSDVKITVKPEFTELTGSEMNIYFNLNDKECVTTIPTTKQIGTTFEIGFNISDLYFFDSFSGEVL